MEDERDRERPADVQYLAREQRGDVAASRSAGNGCSPIPACLSSTKSEIGSHCSVRNP